MKLYNNLAFWSAVSGFLGALLTFKFGLPEEIHADGHGYLLLEQIDQNQVLIAKVYHLLGNVGLLLIAVSFFLQLFDIVKNARTKTTKLPD